MGQLIMTDIINGMIIDREELNIEDETRAFISQKD
jgi:hypothetical protein